MPEFKTQKLALIACKVLWRELTILQRKPTRKSIFSSSPRDCTMTRQP